jgi:hypothetical protein
MPIKVDEAYLRHAMTILQQQIATEVVTSPRGQIEGAKVLAGYSIPSGESLEGQVTTQGTNTHKTLVDLGNLANTRGNQLSQFVTMTNDAEKVNDMSAAEWATRLPGWVPGGKTS